MKCAKNGCDKNARRGVSVHGSPEVLMSCDDEGHYRDIQRAERRRIRRELGIKQPRKNKENYRRSKGQGGAKRAGRRAERAERKSRGGAR